MARIDHRQTIELENAAHFIVVPRHGLKIDLHINTEDFGAVELYMTVDECEHLEGMLRAAREASVKG
jgi:hypothetical protein